MVICSEITSSSLEKHDWCKITRNSDQSSAMMQNKSSNTILVDEATGQNEDDVVINCGSEIIPGPARQDPVILLAALRACSFLSLKPRGMAIHGFAIKMGFDSDVFVGGALVDFHGKCGDLEYAQQVFHGLSTRDG